MIDHHRPAAARSRLPSILAGAVISALAVLAAAVAYALNRGDEVTARWETAGAMTTSPWTPSIVKPGAPIDVPGDFVGTASVTSVAAGDDCDKEALKKHLGSDPQLAKNWAQVLGITVGEINGYVDRLQSRRLMVPVQVTNHDYEGDSPRELQSVLDVGTAVLTDADGTPRVRCACGNPLKPAQAAATKFNDVPPGRDTGAVVTKPAANTNATAIRVITKPIVKTPTGIEPKSGYSIKDPEYPNTYRCIIGGETPYGRAAARCGGHDFFGPCWIEEATAFCLLHATDTTLERYPVYQIDSPSEVSQTDEPTTVDLSDRRVCSKNTGSGAEFSYFCSALSGEETVNRPAIWEKIDRSHSTWTARVALAETSPQTITEVRIAYYAVDKE